MKIIIDADACPVIENTIAIAQQYNIPTTLVFDYNHELHYEDVTLICVAQGNDASDHKIFALCNKGDIVITNDGGLANLILGKIGIPISFSGFLYTIHNIEQILMERHINAKMRKTKKHYTHIPKRTINDDIQFEDVLEKLIIENIGNSKY